jgi:hypothetical protein
MKTLDSSLLVIMVVSIPIRIVVSYNFTILPQLTDTYLSVKKTDKYRDGILIW